MTVLTGFFDNVRQYGADEWARVFRGLGTSGVLSTIGGAFAVTAGPGLGVTVASGLALLQGYFYYSDASQPLSLNAADVTNPRIDRIIIRLTISTKSVVLTKLTGAPAGVPVAPPLTQGADIYEIPLAQVAVAANAVSIVSGNLTDQRSYAGSILSDHNHTAVGDGGKLSNPRVVAAVMDTNGNTMFNTVAIASAINYLQMQNAAAGSPAYVVLSATGASTNVGMQIYTKGAGHFQIWRDGSTMLWQLTNLGIVNAPFQSIARASPNAQQVLTPLTLTRKVYGSEVTDSQSEFASNVFVPSVSGVYLVAGTLAWTASLAATDTIFYVLSGATGATELLRIRQEKIGTGAGGISWPFHNFAIVFPMTAGQTYGISVYNDAGRTLEADGHIVFVRLF
jgi:hypothetical protein